MSDVHTCAADCGHDTEEFRYDGPEVRTTEKMVHLHIHTEHSFLDGIPTLTDLCERVTELNQDAIAITDHGECSGHLRFQKAADKAGIKPIFGMEGYFCDDRTQKVGKKGELYDHITVLAQNETGLRNLWALSSEAFISGQWYGDPRFDWELLDKYGEGLIVTGGCLSGAVAKYLNPENAQADYERAMARLARFQEVLNGRVYLELHTFNDEKQRIVNKALVELASELSVGLIAVSDAHYLRPEDWEDHELLTAIQMGKTYDDPTRYQYGPNQLCVFGEEEVRQRLAYLGESVVSESIANTRDIADSCNVMIKQERSMPVFFDSAETDAIKLREVADEGFERKVKRVAPEERWPEYRARLDYELDLITQKGFPGYFHTVRNIVRKAKDRGMLVGPGRGSAAGSLLSYCMDITEIDPIPPGLIFERFMDPGRDTLPDIDMDFADVDRPVIRQLLVDEYGELNVATIGALDVLKPLALLRDLCRGLRVPSADAKAMADIAKKMPDLNVAHIETKWGDIMREFGPELRPYEEKYPRLFTLMHKFAHHIRHAGVHSAGVVLSKEPLLGRLPLRFKSEDIRTQMDHHDVEELGYPKFDVLGLRTLATLAECWHLVKQRQPENCPAWYDDWQYEYSKYYEDSAVYESLWAGKNIGVFQLESAGLRQLAKRFRPRHLEDVCALISVYRPGITRTYDEETGENLLDLYIKRRDGEIEPTYKHPLLEKVLGPTHGNFLYQEQIMKVCEVLAGYSLAETDRVRKILGKKEVKKMQAERAIFVEGCRNTNEISDQVANSIFDDMEEFGKYGFNKSHGWAYGIVAYWCAYMKHYFPREFMCALFKTNEDDAPLYARECQRLGIPLLGPDINESEASFSLTPAGVIRYGLSKIKFLGASAPVLAELRPFTDIDDLVARVPKTKFNKQKAHSAMAVGAMDSLVSDEMAAQYPDWWNKTQVALYRYYEVRGDWKAIDDECDQCGGHSNFEHLCEELRLSNRAEVEKEYLGSVVSVDPLKPFVELLATHVTYIREDDMLSGEVQRLGGIISRVNPLVTKQGKNPGSPMCQMWVDLPALAVKEDEAGADEQVQIVVWPEDYKKYSKDIEPGVPILADVRKLDNGGVCLRKMFRLDRMLEAAS